MDNALYHIKIILNLGVGLHQYCNSLVSNLPEHFNISFKLYKTSLADEMQLLFVCCSMKRLVLLAIRMVFGCLVAAVLLLIDLNSIFY